MANRISRRQALLLGGGALAGATTLGSVAGARSAAAATGTVQLDLVTTTVIPMSVDTHAARAAIFRIRLA